jgi:hypothetical protein
MTEGRVVTYSQHVAVCGGVLCCVCVDVVVCVWRCVVVCVVGWICLKVQWKQLYLLSELHDI